MFDLACNSTMLLRGPGQVAAVGKQCEAANGSSDPIAWNITPTEHDLQGFPTGRPGLTRANTFLTTDLPVPSAIDVQCSNGDERRVDPKNIGGSR